MCQNINKWMNNPLKFGQSSQCTLKSLLHDQLFWTFVDIGALFSSLRLQFSFLSLAISASMQSSLSKIASLGHPTVARKSGNIPQHTESTPSPVGHPSKYETSDNDRKVIRNIYQIQVDSRDNSNTALGYSSTTVASSHSLVKMCWILSFLLFELSSAKVCQFLAFEVALEIIEFCI